ncbi:MAG: HYR domain-containing protein, partial [Flavobacteriaceae bacterium]|nr:HYR domain-containing protein [Flavobacteriaceae bacterium]
MKKAYLHFIALWCLFSNVTYARHTPTTNFKTINDRYTSFLIDDTVSRRIDTSPMVTPTSNSTPEVFAMTCPGDISVNIDTGTCGAVVNYTQPTTDIIGGGTTLSSGLPIGAIFPVGTTIVVWQENSAIGTLTGLTCSFTVTVIDNEPPTTPTLPAVTVDCNGTLTAPTTTDACAGVITGTTSNTLAFNEGGG